MKYHVKLSNELLDDLSQLSDYLVSEFSEAVSKNILASLFDTFESLGEFPYKGKDAATLMFTFNGYRYLPLKQNVVFYTVDEGNQTVTLLRLYSVTEDPMQKFKRYLE